MFLDSNVTLNEFQELSLRDPRVHPVLCDLRVEEDVRNTFQYLEDNLGGVDVLVNNAGVAGHKGLLGKEITIRRETVEYEYEK